MIKLLTIIDHYIGVYKRSKMITFLNLNMFGQALFIMPYLEQNGDRAVLLLIFFNTNQIKYRVTLIFL